MLWVRNYHFVTECWQCHPGSCEIFVLGSLVVFKNMFNSKSIKHGTFDRGSQGTSILFFKAVNYIYLVKSHALSHLDFINSVARSDCHCPGTGEAE